MSGRPGLGLGHVDQLIGDIEPKRRLKAILATLGGQMSVEQACEQIRLRASRFHELRQEVLDAALAALNPRAAGRPRRAPEPPSEIETLRRELDQCKFELFRLRVREEILLSIPGVLSQPATSPTCAEKRGRRRMQRRTVRGNGVA